MTLLLGFLVLHQVFQLTSSRRGWQYTLYFLFNCVNISTHILTKRMTSFPRTCQCIHHFNSHPHEEDDYVKTCNLRTLTYFNSHPHEEDDPAKSCKFLTNGYFNSHPHEEDDIGMKKSTIGKNISTHILTKRMTAGSRLQNTKKVFQLTSSRRGWRRNILSQLWNGLFQLTSSRRGWPLLEVLKKTANLFQLTSSRRGWRWISWTCSNKQVFQLTSSRRGWQIFTAMMSYSQGISTHILTKRMTWNRALSSGNIYISTHILTKRMTNTDYTVDRSKLFQLTSSRRGWPMKYIQCFGKK